MDGEARYDASGGVRVSQVPAMQQFLNRQDKIKWTKLPADIEK
jgi:hypothetical protein